MLLKLREIFSKNPGNIANIRFPRENTKYWKNLLQTKTRCFLTFRTEKKVVFSSKILNETEKRPC